MAYIRYLGDEEFYSLSTDGEYVLSNTIQSCPLDFYFIIPVNNDTVDLKSLYSWLEVRMENFYSYSLMYDYTKYINDGMTLEEVSKNLRDLASKAK